MYCQNKFIITKIIHVRCYLELKVGSLSKRNVAFVHKIGMINSNRWYKYYFEFRLSGSLRRTEKKITWY